MGRSRVKLSPKVALADVTARSLGKTTLSKEEERRARIVRKPLQPEAKLIDPFDFHRRNAAEGRIELTEGDKKEARIAEVPLQPEDIIGGIKLLKRITDVSPKAIEFAKRVFQGRTMELMQQMVPGLKYKAGVLEYGENQISALVEALNQYPDVPRGLTEAIDFMPGSGGRLRVGGSRNVKTLAADQQDIEKAVERLESDIGLPITGGGLPVRDAPTGREIGRGHSQRAFQLKTDAGQDLSEMTPEELMEHSRRPFTPRIPLEASRQPDYLNQAANEAWLEWLTVNRPEEVLEFMEELARERREIARTRFTDEFPGPSRSSIEGGSRTYSSVERARGRAASERNRRGLTSNARAVLDDWETMFNNVETDTGTDAARRFDSRMENLLTFEEIESIARQLRHDLVVLNVSPDELAHRRGVSRAYQDVVDAFRRRAEQADDPVEIRDEFLGVNARRILEDLRRQEPDTVPSPNALLAAMERARGAADTDFRSLTRDQRILFEDVEGMMGRSNDPGSRNAAARDRARNRITRERQNYTADDVEAVRQMLRNSGSGGDIRQLNELMQMGDEATGNEQLQGLMDMARQGDIDRDGVMAALRRDTPDMSEDQIEALTNSIMGAGPRAGEAARSRRLLREARESLGAPEQLTLDRPARSSGDDIAAQYPEARSDLTSDARIVLDDFETMWGYVGVDEARAAEVTTRLVARMERLPFEEMEAVREQLWNEMHASTVAAEDVADLEQRYIAFGDIVEGFRRDAMRSRSGANAAGVAPVGDPAIVREVRDAFAILHETPDGVIDSQAAEAIVQQVRGMTADEISAVADGIQQLPEQQRGLLAFEWDQLVTEVRREGRAAPAAAAATTSANNLEDVRFNVPDEVRLLLGQNDNLGFERPGEAARAILEHDDWAQRWDIAERSAVGVLRRWRERLLRERPDIADRVRGGGVAQRGRDIFDNDLSRSQRIHLADFEEIVQAELTGDNEVGRRAAERFFNELSNVPREELGEHLATIRTEAARRGGDAAGEEFRNIVAGVEDPILPTSRRQLHTSIEKFIAGELTEEMLLKLLDIARQRRLISAEEAESFPALVRISAQTARGEIPDELMDLLGGEYD